MNKQEVLQSALEGRNQEIDGYQINIDNYVLAIKHIETSGDVDLFPFKEQLTALLQSETLEQKKAKVIRDVIASQLEG